MEELYYFPSAKVNSKISELINPGHHIQIDDYVYERLSRKPKGRSIFRRLSSLDEKTSITIYS